MDRDMRKLLILCIFTVFGFADNIALIEVKDMHCPLCTASVKKAILQTNGVRSVSVKLNTKTATVVYDEAVDIQNILDSIKTTSYEGKIISNERAK
jgi:mercuric ion binding protein